MGGPAFIAEQQKKAKSELMLDYSQTILSRKEVAMMGRRLIVGRKIHCYKPEFAGETNPILYISNPRCMTNTATMEPDSLS